ncbi:MAG: type III-B CRISPR module RAMP protein Cmr6 [Gammaproteobacteria bacterium]|nr:type III-B CRISPR module RAMP protein Cmr6 [Gammaproteobacteria bacterium]
MRPLYKPWCNEDPDRTKDNLGLWYDKFCDQWCRNPEYTSSNGTIDEGWTLKSFGSSNPKLDWIKTVTNGTVGDAKLLSGISERTKKLLTAHGQEPLPFKTAGPFVTGLGRGHPVENGFAWHHSLGVPYLPGASVKGTVRAWVEQWLAENTGKTKQIFGPNGDEARKNPDTGSVIFLDALPSSPVHLQPDIMTPHYAPYYQNGEPPADWYSPIPIPFLVVAPGTTFLFGVLPRNARNTDDCESVQKWLRKALDAIGAGAKTAVGYGRFEPV